MILFPAFVDGRWAMSDAHGYDARNWMSTGLKDGRMKSNEVQ